MLQFRSVFIVLGFLLLDAPLVVQAQKVQQPSAEDYEQGVRLFEKGLYAQAAQELEVFMERYPDHELNQSAAYYYARALGRTNPSQVPAYYERFIRSHPNNMFARKLLFELARVSEEELKYQQAINYYERVLNQNADDKQVARTYYRMAEAYVSMGDKQKARSVFMTLADDFPQSEWAPKALYARGRLYLSENDFDSSSAAFELLRERYPHHDMTRRIGTALGESYYQQGRYRQAVEAFKNAIPYLDEELKAKAVYLIAESYNYLNNFDQASTHYLQYINLKKGTDEVRKAHYGLGWIYNKQEIYHWASDSFEKAAGGDDELARKALYYKAVNEKLGGRYGEAIETFRTFGERYKQGLWIEEAYYEWAVTAFEMGNYSEAIEVLLPLVRSDEELTRAGKVYTLLGEAYFANKEYTRSMQAFEAADKLTNIDPEVKLQARFQRAWVQYRNQAYDQAQDGFARVYRAAPNTKLGREALFWSADAYYNMEHYGPASAQLEDFLRNNAGHELSGAAQYSLGWSYFKMGEYEKAIPPLETFIENYEPPPIALFPYDTDTRLRLGDAYYATGDYASAIQQYQKAIGAEPGGDYAMFQVANSHYRAEQTYEAVTTFRRFLRIYPYSRLREQAQYNIAYIYLNTGNYTQAIEEFQTVISKYPNTSWAARSQYNIGDAYYNAGEYDRAVAAYKKLMNEYPKSDYIIEAVNGIQYAQLSAGQPDSSTAILEEFLAKHPQARTADRLRYRKAENLLQAGDYENAIEELRQYIRITNNQQALPDAHFNLAGAYEQTGQTGQAVEAYQVVVNSYFESERAAPSLAALGNIAYEQGNYQASFDYFSKMLEKGSSYVLEARIGMGNAQLAMDGIEEARKQYEAALERNGNYAPANVGLGKVALRNENYSEAGDLLSLVAEANTTEVGAEAQYLLGVVEQRQGQYRQALDAYTNVAVLYEAFDEWVAKALLRSAECHIQLGNPGEARNLLNTVAEDYPESPEAREAQRLLQSD